MANSPNYLFSFFSHDNDILRKMDEINSARNDIQPSVEPEIGRFLGFMVRLTGAKRVLELGTSVGYSTIWIAEALRETGGTIDTIDNHARTKIEAEKNFQNAGIQEYVNMHFGDAKELLKKFSDKSKDVYDLIFQDCGKSLYPDVHEDLVLLLRPGGVLIVDDTLFAVQSGVRKGLGRYTHKYLKMIQKDKRFYSVTLPVGHGLTLMLKR